ncbi:methylmalonyl Co-A mutase-associated GTPase MeaB [Algoriphagus pacificus]|uniref:Methylmalonyl Co-A mutase-associated GTPase MeaB n=1 Tax=Algoriphagus pacificus TaxID=2811234 RepID=A0ABS3CDN5_9BACT|nr:methylmalonyl Co-A mutase-associated GTPase MeaB [Algoriphagus pacificus]MBN7815226.1 methylmalonyl Co-A mutase-associated GTPase MeaB [Algoriphagus pacificus]
MKKRLSLDAYKSGVLQGNRVILSQAITLVESRLEEDMDLAAKLVQEILPATGKSIRIGITGVPGVGKSTFIEAFGKLLIQEGKKLAVLAVDPSSQKSKGSILGDKTRMEKLAADKQAFIRPSPAGFTLGGVASKTREAMLLCEAAGFDMILVETVGVGQSETAVKDMVDFFLLLVLAGAGDELQGIKKGIMEMADAVIIHKSDGENLEMAKQAKRNYQNALHLFPAAESGWSVPVLTASSYTKTGLEDIWNVISNYEAITLESGFKAKNRAEQRVKWLEENLRDLLGNLFFKQPEVQSKLKTEKEKVAKGELSPMVLAKELIQIFIQNK